MAVKKAAKEAEPPKKRRKSAGVLPGQREDHEKYSAEVSAAVRNS
jgi:hypothetical protein